MSHKVITWVDLQGRFRSTLPAYESLKNDKGLEDEQEALVFVWSSLVRKGREGITEDHPYFIVDSDILAQRLEEICFNDFRYVAIPDSEGRRSGVGGSWEMGDDGLPQINMAKARGIQMDNIRMVRNKELAKKDIEFMRALEADDGSSVAITVEKQTLRDIPQTFDLTTYTPEELKNKWPEGLSKDN